MSELILGTGRIVDPPSQKDWGIRSVQAPRKTPNYCTWLGRLGPVLNQGQTPKCVTHGASVVKTFQERKEHRRTYLYDTDEAYRRCKEKDGIPHLDGTYTRVMLDIMRLEGYGRKSHNWEGDAPRWKIDAFARLRTISEIEEAIYYHGPILIGVDWLSNWYSNSRLLDTPDKIVNAGGHLMCAAGYNRRLGLLWFRNSWGHNAHICGNVPMTYRELERQLTLPDWQSADAWSVLDMTQVDRKFAVSGL